MERTLKWPKHTELILPPRDQWRGRTAFTAVSTKVVQKKRKSVRDNAEWWSGKYSNTLKAQNPLFLLTHTNKYS